MYTELLLHGWGVDHLRDGFFLMCVRPAKKAELPGVELPPHPQQPTPQLTMRRLKQRRRSHHHLLRAKRRRVVPS